MSAPSAGYSAVIGHAAEEMGTQIPVIWSLWENWLSVEVSTKNAPFTPRKKTTLLRMPPAIRWMVQFWTYTQRHVPYVEAHFCVVNQVPIQKARQKWPSRYFLALPSAVVVFENRNTDSIASRSCSGGNDGWR
jgi:hypothetical protein